MSHRLGAVARPPADIGDLVVVDLSALWAGPLVGAVLVRAGARVVKVESTTRPDGARVGSPRHFATLDHGKMPETVDLTTPFGRSHLQRLVAGADVVITSARPRALEQFGLDAAESLRAGRSRVWVMVTGYGTGPGSADRVAFGDDAAAAGGLVVRDERGPCFCADAVADPVTGLAASAAVLGALVAGGEHLLVASMADVAGSLVDAPGPGPSPGTGTGQG
ncbi:MAG TPA: CoA transferase [Acidimicrobiales bacterium]